MIRHLRDIQARRRGEELVEKGFTLIELLIVIVVLGILAATVVFALTGVTGQSAVAACNSDAKTVETAVQAYIDSPDNATNTPPATVGDLITAPFSNPYGHRSDTFHAAPTNTAYAITLVRWRTRSSVTPSRGCRATARTTQYDHARTNPCSSRPVRRFRAVHQQYQR